MEPIWISLPPRPESSNSGGRFLQEASDVDVYVFGRLVQLSQGRHHQVGVVYHSGDVSPPLQLLGLVPIARLPVTPGKLVISRPRWEKRDI